MLRLHKALLNQNVDSLVLTQEKTSDLPSVLRLAKTKPQKLMEKIRPALSQLPLAFYPQRQKDVFSPNGLSNKALIKAIKELKPDILHLHWIAGGFLNFKDLEALDMPMLWSLHDANPYTGGCHYVAAACIGVGVHCKKCPLLNSRHIFDLSFWTFRVKEKTYPKLNLTINGLSRWIANCAKESLLLGNKPIINLPNPIDTNIYKPISKTIARDLLGLDSEKKIITFGAIQATSIDRKGYPQLKGALKILKNKINMRLIVFGASNGESIEGIETLYLGHLSDDIALRIVYSLSDVVVMPSLVESFGQVALESLACGTPAVAFDTSGLKDIIDHKINGYLAKPYDETDLARGILYVLENAKTLSPNARAKATQSFDSKLVAKQYLRAYQNLAQGFEANEGGGQWQHRFLESFVRIFTQDSADSLTLTKQLSKSHLFDFLSADSTHYIAFGAISGTNISRKGYSELIQALKILREKNPKQTFELLVFGSSSGEQIAGIKTHFLGMKYDDESLRLIYNAASVFVTPSLAENLSNAIMESLACGTPVVAFDIGGNGDMISHKQNGYLASNIEGLAQGISWVLESKHYSKLSQNARKKVLDNFNAANIAQKYINQYAQILGLEAIEGGGQYDVILCLTSCCIDNFLHSILLLKFQTTNSISNPKKQEVANFSHIFTQNFSHYSHSYFPVLGRYSDKSYVA